MLQLHKIFDDLVSRIEKLDKMYLMRGVCFFFFSDAVTVMENDRSDNTMKLLTVNEKLPKSRRQKNPKM